MKIKNLDSFPQFFFIYTLYKILIEIAYCADVSYWYSYLGFVLEPNPAKCIISYVLFWSTLLYLPRGLSISAVMINLFYTICIIPGLSFYWLADKRTLYVLYSLLFFSIMVLVGTQKKKPIVILNGSRSQYTAIMNVLFTGYVFMCLYLGIRRGGIDRRAFSFSSIYDLRGDFTAAGTVFGYLMNWCTKSLYSVFAIYFLYKGQYLRTGICFVLQIFMYLCFGFKAYLLSAVFCFLIYFWGRYSARNGKTTSIRNVFVFIAMAIPGLFSKCPGLIGKAGFLANGTYSMRMLFEPARIRNGYFEFFSRANKLFFSEGLIGKIFGLKYPYNRPIGFIITQYLNGADAVSNSNTGIIADAYAELGFPGIILIAITTGLVFRLLQRICVHIPPYVAAAIMAYPVFMLNDNPLLTNLLTDGWMLDIVMLVLVEGAFRENKPYDNLQDRSENTM